MEKKLVSNSKSFIHQKHFYNIFYFCIVLDVRPARRHGADKKEVERDRSPVSDYFDRGRDVTRYPVDPNAPPPRAAAPQYR